MITSYATPCSTGKTIRVDDFAGNPEEADFFATLENRRFRAVHFIESDLEALASEGGKDELREIRAYIGMLLNRSYERVAVEESADMPF
jgi:hypothetical protein